MDPAWDAIFSASKSPTALKLDLDFSYAIIKSSPDGQLYGRLSVSKEKGATRVG
jgi:hypothetical protein